MLVRQESDVPPSSPPFLLLVDKAAKVGVA